MRASRPRLLLLALALGTLGLGIGATAYWLVRSDPAQFAVGRLPEVALALAITVVVTLMNVGLRWIRWHFLTRRTGIDLSTRDSLLAYVATLPAIATPFYVGELVRVPLLGGRYPRHRSAVVWIFMLERSTDLFVVSIFVAIVRGWWLPFAASGLLWGVFALALLAFTGSAKRTRLLEPTSLCALFGLTALAWFLPGLSLWGIVALTDGALELGPVLGVFSYSTVLGGLSGLPLGTGVTGSSMITLLQGEGVGLSEAVMSTAIFRAGTAWVTLVIGSSVAFVYRRRLIQMSRSTTSTDHFDEIAHAYESEIPTVVRDRLLARKIAIMRSWFEEGDHEGARVLDVGGGQGWYACEMARAGYETYTIDRSSKQVDYIERNARAQGVVVHAQTGSATKLPFPDGFFHCAYAINVAHHVVEEEARTAMFDEVVRVLAPGGVFFLHEINTSNPLFRFYMGYVFPLLRAIDEGTEKWIRPDQLQRVTGAHWRDRIEYLTFIPDFAPAWVLRSLAPLERALESSSLRSWSAHFVAALVKDS